MLMTQKTPDESSLCYGNESEKVREKSTIFHVLAREWLREKNNAREMKGMRDECG